ncbi:MAG: glycoside hydrolase family 92 protein [Actinobacteria bacterium]|nr:MAG: glycoside hydrolase family 92 protein [Actinomycetota bacterium]RIK03992.1 MAG: glycoside hydrolase family 92 protein [Acidobacteriota bacterium]
MVALVNPFIGTAPADVDDPVPGGASGATWPGAVVPFGTVQWNPDTPGAENETGYAYADDAIEGFSLFRFSGAGCPNNELVRFMPLLGGPDEPAGFSHDTEAAEPGFYRVSLDDGIDVELTASTRAGVARLTFPETDDAQIVVDAAHHETTFPIEFAGSVVETVGDTAIRGTAPGGQFCGTPGQYQVHFHAEFDRPFTVVSDDAAGTARLAFDTTEDTLVEVRVGLSWVSTHNAEANLRAELGDRSFDEVRSEAREQWAELLGRVSVEGGSEGQQRVFATALYHSFLHPNVDSDVNGEYLGFGGEVHTLPEGQLHYASFSGWDIYRSQVQLLAVVVPERAEDIARSMLAMAEECGGGLPKWTAANVETSVMIGDPGSLMMSNLDAFGISGPDPAAVLEAMRRSAFEPGTQCGWLRLRPGLSDYLRLGYTPSIPYEEAQTELRFVYMWSNDLGDVSTTLEYAMADAAIAAYAARHGDDMTAADLQERASNWEEVFDPSVGYVRPRLEDGSFYVDFDPASNYSFTEGNAAQYTWMVPQDYGSLVEAIGGSEEAVARLDDLFAELNAGLSQPHFYIGNEPLFTAPWAYLWAGEPAKAQAVVRRILTEQFSDAPGGLPGNDDLGAMSSWYVWAAMGMFPTVPGEDVLTLNTPLFPSITIAVPGRRPIHIDTPGAPEAPYIASASLDGEPLERAWLRFSDLAEGATIVFTTTTEPSNWAGDPGSAPPSPAAG